MIGQLVHGIVTDNNDPLMLGRIKFRSVEFLNNLEHPTWAEPSSPCLGQGWGFFMVPEVGASIHVFVPMNSDDSPVYLAANPLTTDDIPVEATQSGYYLKRAILKFKNIGYLLFDTLDKVVTILSTDKAHVIATNKAAVSAPRVNLGALDISDDTLQVVRKKDLQQAVNDVIDACNAKFAQCYPGSGVGAATKPTAQASTVTYSE